MTDFQRHCQEDNFFSPRSSCASIQRRNAAWVASRIESSRRREDLGWSCHAEVAPLEPADQDRWLDRALAVCSSSKAAWSAVLALAVRPWWRPGRVEADRQPL